jgi:hypothetical protein
LEHQAAPQRLLDIERAASRDFPAVSSKVKKAAGLSGSRAALASNGGATYRAGAKATRAYRYALMPAA